MPHSLEDDSGVRIPGLADITHDLFPQWAWRETQAEINKKESRICKCVTCSCPRSFLRVWAVTGLVHTALGFLDSGEEGAHPPAQLGPWGSCYEHPGANSLSNFHLQQHQVSWENTSSSRSSSDDPIPTSGFSLLGPSHPPHHSKT